MDVHVEKSHQSELLEEELSSKAEIEIIMIKKGHSVYQNTRDKKDKNAVLRTQDVNKGLHQHCRFRKQIK